MENTPQQPQGFLWFVRSKSKFIAIALIAIALPATVVLLSQRQDLRQRAEFKQQACKTDRECPSGLLCRDSFCQDPNAITSLPTPTTASPSTFVMTNQEGGSCRSDSNCNSGQTCVNGICTGTAITSAPTTPPAQSCRGDSQCPTGQRCINNFCQPANIGSPPTGIPTPTASSVRCDNTIQCPNGQICLNRFCQGGIAPTAEITDTPAGYCLSNTQCPIGFSCSPSARRCVPNPTNTPVPTIPAIVPPTHVEPIITTATCAKRSQGDANCDGVIDLLDFNLWRIGFIDGAGQLPSGSSADFNNDNVVDLLDFNIWKTNFQ